MSGLAIGISGLVMSAGGMAMNLSNASKQKKLIGQAEAAGEAAMVKAKKVIEVNYMEGLPLPKEAYELERDSILSGGAQALSAGVEGSQRGVSAVAGAVNQAQGKAARRVAASQEQLITDNMRQAAQQDVVLQNQRLGIELGGVQGAQQAVSDATRSQQQSLAQAAQQAGQIGMSVLGNEAINPLYKKAGNQSMLSPLDKFKINNQMNSVMKSGAGLENSFQQPTPPFNPPSLSQPTSPFNPNMDFLPMDLYSVPGVTSTGVV
jgi:hypothetical protein